MATEVWTLKHVSQQTSTHEGIKANESKGKAELRPTLLKKQKRKEIQCVRSKTNSFVGVQQSYQCCKPSIEKLEWVLNFKLENLTQFFLYMFQPLQPLNYITVLKKKKKKLFLSKYCEPENCLCVNSKGNFNVFYHPTTNFCPYFIIISVDQSHSNRRCQICKLKM